MLITEEAYLQHYGKKGMKWGVRKKKKPLTAKERQRKTERNVKIAKGVITTGLTVLWLSSFFVEGSKTTSGSYKQATRNVPPPKAKSAADFINERRNIEVASLKRMHKEGKMDAQQAENFLRILNARYDRKVAAAV
jgi:hypothetical protein